MGSKLFTKRSIIAAIAVLCLGLAQWKNIAPLQWVGLIFYLTCLGMYGKSLYNTLFKMRKITADLLLVTVMTVSLAAGEPLSGALVAWFISMGLAIAFSIIERTGKKINALTRQTKKTARRMEGDGFQEVPVGEIQAGDRVMVPCGEMIPVDGKVIQGSGDVDESVVTGEPFTVLKAQGDKVLAGSVAVTAPLTVEADKPGDHGFVYALAREMEKALKNKPQIHRRADQIVQFFIGGVVIYAFGVFVVTGWMAGDATHGLMRMAAVTAIACPCAWALSVPTAFAAAIGGLSGRGILVRGGEPLELAGRTQQVVLDKTGTLTLSRPTVSQIHALGQEKNQDQILAMAAAVEGGFTHPMARAIGELANEKGLALPTADQLENIPGQGVTAMVEGKKVIIGAKELFQSMDIPIPQGPEGKGVWMAVDGKIEGFIAILDQLKEEAQGLGGRLRNLGVKQVTLATGDSQETEAQRVAQGVAADHFHWGLAPADKQRLVKELKEEGITLMAGDGVNDSTALAEADVAVSMGSGKADLAIRSSDIIILGEETRDLTRVLKTGRRLMRTILQNYAWAIGFNTVGIALATVGMLSPWAAALFHHASSVLVVANSARLIRQDAV